MRLVPTLAVLLTLGACSQPKPDDRGIDKALTPRAAVAEFANVRGHIVRWGGVVIESKNQKDATQLEVLAYPLDRDGRPRRNAEPLGRFIANKAGYLETVDYAPGRLVTITGPLQETQTRKLGETDYPYPVIVANDLKLWKQHTPREEPRFHFGIGIGIGHSF